MSTTTDKATALFYAKGGADKAKRAGPALLFETQMGMVDRGAELGWLSQYPHEAEVLFAPPEDSGGSGVESFLVAATPVGEVGAKKVSEEG